MLNADYVFLVRNLMSLEPNGSTKSTFALRRGLLFAMNLMLSALSRRITLSFYQYALHTPSSERYAMPDSRYPSLASRYRDRGGSRLILMTTTLSPAKCALGMRRLMRARLAAKAVIAPGARAIAMRCQAARAALPKSKTMRFVVARRHGRRGEGLGNEMLPWAKGWITSRVLDARLVGPSWGINKRRYYRNFRTTRLDIVFEEMLLRLPHHTFTEEDYRATEQTEFGSAVRCWAKARGLTRKASYIVSVGGMWGGYPSIRAAGAFLAAKLLNSRDALDNVYQVVSKLDRNKLFVAVHMRSPVGGHNALLPGESARGKFNILIPGEWYLWVCEALQKRFGSRIEFRFFTDRGGPDFEAAIRRFNPGQATQGGLTECSDLILMARADLRVCSISSYSLAASFLSDGPYVWYEPQLTLHHGLYSIWGNENDQQLEGSLSSRSREFLSDMIAGRASADGRAVTFLGSAMDVGDPLPESLVTLLEQKLSSKDPRTNLLEYGSLPAVRP